MHCMKCGTKLPEGQVFCDSCLEEMERYPVRPGTAVHLPQRSQLEQAKKTAPKKKASPQEETAAKLRRIIVWLTVLVAALSICLGVAAVVLVEHFQEADPDETIGQNYSTITPHDPTQ